MKKATVFGLIVIVLIVSLSLARPYMVDFGIKMQAKKMADRFRHDLLKDGKLHVGENLEFEASLLYKGKSITDKELLDNLEVHYSFGFRPSPGIALGFTGASGFTDEKESRKILKRAISDERALGEHTIGVRFKALKNTTSL